MKLTFIILVAFQYLVIQGVAETNPGKYRAILWADKGEFPLGKSVPGVIEVRSKTAFPVLKDGSGEKTFSAAGQAGKGRVLGFAHGAFLGEGALMANDVAANVLANSLRWAGGKDMKVVGLHSSVKGLSSVVKKAGFESQLITPSELNPAKTSVYCLIAHARDLQEVDIQAILNYIDAGGGVIVATTPWAFAKRYPDFSTFPGNRILAKAGLYFSPSGYASNKLPVVVSRPIESIPVAERVWNKKPSNHPAVKAVEALTENKYINAPEKQKQLVAMMKRGRTVGGEDIGAYLNALQLLNGSMGGIKPTRTEPVTPGKFPIVDAIIEMETHFNLTLPAGMMYHIPAANDFPGKVPGHAPIVTKEMSINCDFKGWASQRNAGGWNAKEIRPTGIYAPPGKVITVIVPEALVAKGYEVLIGSYAGGLNNRKTWHRYPRTQRSTPVRDVETTISNGFGGLVGIRIPRDANLGDQKVTIHGGIDAPFYEHGKTDLALWNSQIRNHLAPMAEFASDRIIITVPSEDMRDVTDPDKLMELWDQIIETSAELAMVGSRDQYRAERIVFDRQPAAGSLHSGYPVCGAYRKIL